MLVSPVRVSWCEGEEKNLSGGGGGIMTAVDN